MIARWADQEDENNGRFPKRNSDKQGNGNSHFDKGQWNHSRTPESASRTMKSRLLSAIRMARSQGTMTHSLRKSCTNNARCTRSHDTRSLSASASVCHSRLHLFSKRESERTRRMMTRVTSRGLMISTTRRMPSTSSLVETVDCLPSARRS
jgi:hypothetical protein